MTVSGKKEELVARLKNGLGGVDTIEVEVQETEKGVVEAMAASKGPR